jgi:hypothetical protein
MCIVNSVQAKNKITSFYYNLLSNIDGRVPTEVGLEDGKKQMKMVQGEYITPIHTENLKMQVGDFEFGFKFKDRVSLFRISSDATLHDVVNIEVIDMTYSPNRVAISIKDEKFTAFIHNRRIELENYYLNSKVDDVLTFIGGGDNKL